MRKTNIEYDGLVIEKLYDNGRYIATVYFNDYKGTYEVLHDANYDYYEGRRFDEDDIY